MKVERVSVHWVNPTDLCDANSYRLPLTRKKRVSSEKEKEHVNPKSCNLKLTICVFGDFLILLCLMQIH